MSNSQMPIMIEEEESVPAQNVLLIKNAHRFIGSVPLPFSDPAYEWEVPQPSLRDLMSETMPRIGTHFDGLQIDSIIKSVKGRAILRACIANRFLRLDHPTFVDAAHHSLDAHSRHASLLYQKMNREKQAELKRQIKQERQLEKEQGKLQRAKDREVVKAQKQLEKEARMQSKRNDKLLKEVSARTKKQKANREKQSDGESSSENSTEEEDEDLTQPCLTRC